MVFYVVQGEKVVERFMCDNYKCGFYKTRECGMPMDNARTRFQVCSMQEFDACSLECEKVISGIQREICE